MKSWNLAMEGVCDHSCLHRLITAQVNLWMYRCTPIPEHMQPLTAQLTNIIKTRMDRAKKQGKRHLTHTQQDYEEADNQDYTIDECRQLSIVSYYQIKKKDTQAKIITDKQARHPGDLPQWSKDLSHRRVHPEDQENCSRKRNCGYSASRFRSRNRASYPSGHTTSRGAPHTTPGHSRWPTFSQKRSG